MLFVIVMDVLNALIRLAESQGKFSPLGHSAIRSRVFLYADGIAIFAVPVAEDLLLLKEILSMFGDASGLFTNLDKCVATPALLRDTDISHPIHPSMSDWVFPLQNTWGFHYPSTG